MNTLFHLLGVTGISKIIQTCIKATQIFTNGVINFKLTIGS